MAGTGGDIQFGVRITADNQVFIDGVRASQEEAKKLAEGLSKVADEGKGASSSQESLTAAIFKGTSATELATRAVDKLVETYQEMKTVTMEAQQNQAALDAVIRATGRTAEYTGERLNLLAETLSKATRFDDEEIKKTAATLTTFAALTTTQIEKIIRSAADLSSAGFGSLESNAQVLAKSIVETGNSFGALERKLGDLDPAVKRTIESLKAQGEVTAAADLLLQQVSDRVGGTAVAAYSGLTRGVEGNKKAWDDLLKAIGNRLFDAKNQEAGVLENTLKSLTDQVNDNRSAWEKLKGVLGDIARGGPLATLFSSGASQAALDEAGRRSVRVDKPEDFARGAAQRDEARKKAEEGWDKVLARYDREKALAVEINDIKAKGLELGRSEVQIQEAIALAIERSGKAERERAVRQAAQSAKQEQAEYLKSFQQQVRETEKLDKVYGDIVLKLQEAAKHSEQDAALLGARKEDVEFIRKERQLTEAAERAIDELTKNQNAKTAERVAQIRDVELPAALQRLAATRDTTKAYNDNVEAARQEAKLVREIAEQQKRAAEEQQRRVNDLANQLTDMFVRAFEGGRNGARAFLEDLKRMFASTVLRTMVQPVAGAMLGGGASSAFASSGVEGTLMNNVASYALSGASNYLFGTAGAAYVDTLGIGGGGVMTGGTTGAIGAGGFAATIGAGAESLAMAMGVAAESAAAFGASVTAAIPVIGWIIAIAALAYSLFGQSPGGPKGGGFAYGSIGPDGRFQNLGGIAGVEDGGRFFTPNQSDRDMRNFVRQFGQSYYGALDRLGGTSPGALNAAFGFDIDPNGTAQTRISSMVELAGQRVWYSRDRDTDRDYKEHLGPELQLEASRALLAALQASELPTSIGKIIRTLDAATASQEAIDNILKIGEAFRTLTELTSTFDPDAVIKNAEMTAGERLGDFGSKLLDFAGKATLSQQSLQQLIGSTAEYRKAVAELILGFESAKRSIEAMFSSTARNIRLSGMDNMARYQFLQNEADTLLGRVSSATSREEIESLARQINQDINDAFALLSPEEQNRLRQQYLDSINRTNEVIQARVTQLQAEATSEANRVLHDLRNIMDAAADKFAEAGEDMIDAAGTISRSRQYVQVDINVHDDRLDTTVINDGG